jgi:bifunctional DNase/RNase
MLAWELRRDAASAFGTHRAMVAAIRALGGQLESVAINDMSAPDTYRAEVHVSQGGSRVIVEMRPTDALILATICSVAIYVEAAVWASVSR